MAGCSVPGGQVTACWMQGQQEFAGWQLTVLLCFRRSTSESLIWIVKVQNENQINGEFKRLLSVWCAVYKTDASICTAWLSACECPCWCSHSRGKVAFSVCCFQSVGMQQVQEMSSEMCLWQIAAYSPGPMSLCDGHSCLQHSPVFAQKWICPRLRMRSHLKENILETIRQLCILLFFIASSYLGVWLWQARMWATA